MFNLAKMNPPDSFAGWGPAANLTRTCPIGTSPTRARATTLH